MCNEMSQRTAAIFKRNIDETIAYYRRAGFIVKLIKSDGERGVDSLTNHYAAKQIHLNCSSANQHVPIVERKIRQIKERIRAHLSTLQVM